MLNEQNDLFQVSTALQQHKYNRSLETGVCEIAKKSQRDVHGFHLFQMNLEAVV